KRPRGVWDGAVILRQPALSRGRAAAAPAASARPTPGGLHPGPAGDGRATGGARPGRCTPQPGLDDGGPDGLGDAPPGLLRRLGRGRRTTPARPDRPRAAGHTDAEP